MNDSLIIDCTVPRTRPPNRLDQIVSGATRAFIDLGYHRAKIHHIADQAGVGPGTVYLYAEDKEALFELAVLRSLESPIVAHPILPYRKTAAPGQRQLLTDCLHEVAQFPQLWVAAQRREPREAEAEYSGILLELVRWIRRYRNAILLSDRNRVDWPPLAQLFDRVVWNDLHQRLTSYLDSRMRGHLLAPIGDPAAVARFALDGLVAALATGPVGLEGAMLDTDDLLVRLAAAPVVRALPAERPH